MLALTLSLALVAVGTTPKPKPAPTPQAACPVDVTPAAFKHKQHVEKLREGASDKVGGCTMCHDLPSKDHGCRVRLHPGFTCRSCHIRIPGADAAR